jgi:hypothetical protein
MTPGLSISRLDPDIIVNCLSNLLFRCETPLCSLYGYVAEQELDLFQFAAGNVAWGLQNLEVFCTVELGGTKEESFSCAPSCTHEVTKWVTAADVERCPHSDSYRHLLQNGITPPKKFECLRQCLIDHLGVDVARVSRVNELVVVTLCFHHRGHTLVGDDPVAAIR